MPKWAIRLQPIRIFRILTTTRSKTYEIQSENQGRYGLPLIVCFKIQSARGLTGFLLCWFLALTFEYNTLSRGGMVFLKVLNANIGFNYVFKYWGLAPHAEWNVLCTLNNMQITFAIIHFQEIFSFLNILHIKIF